MCVGCLPMKRTHDCQGVARPLPPERSIYCVPQVGHSRFTCLTRADEKADFVPLLPGNRFVLSFVQEE